MIIGYYGQSFFGGGTYYKLSKKENEDNFKFEYIHSIVPNYVINAEEYIQKYETLSFEEVRSKDYFKGKVKIDLLKNNIYIDEIMNICKKANWEKISKKKYSNENLDDENWDFYIEFSQEQKYLISGYSIHPKEVEKIYNLFNSLRDLIDKNGK